MTMQWEDRTEEKSLPASEGWYRVMVSGDSESIDGHTIYSFDDYETWAYFIPDEDGGGSFSGINDEDENVIFAYCGPFTVPKYNTGA